MKVFISWSKSASHQLARLLRDWLPEVIQNIEPWVSSEDISKGQRWASEIGIRLDELDDGIICVTRSNLKEPWINFEAGALAKSLQYSRVRPILLDLGPSDVAGPLAQFQATVATDRADMLRLLSSLNGCCESPLEDTRLERAFGRVWDAYAVAASSIASTPESHDEPPRDVRDMVAEVLQLTRDVQRALVRATPRAAHSSLPLIDLDELRNFTSPEECSLFLSQFRIHQLRDLARSLGMTGTARFMRAELVERLTDMIVGQQARLELLQAIQDKANDTE